MRRGRRVLAAGATLILLAFCVVPESVSAEPAAGRQQELLHLLRHDCGACHGMRLEGSLGPALTVAALAGKSAGSLLDTIRNGRPGTAMPPWQGVLGDEDIVWLVEELQKRESGHD